MSTHIHISEHPALDLARRFCAALAIREQSFIAVSGGSTPRELFRILAEEYSDKIAWGRVTVFQVDERCVPPGHGESNWKMLHETLLRKAPGVTAHRIEAERPNAAEDYESLLVRTLPQNEDGIPQLDLVLLGMGADGHTASLFPETKALYELDHFVVRNDVPQLNAQRITMTYPLINAAHHRWFLVQGADKAEAFARTQEKELPAGQLVDAEWFVDPPVVG